MTAVPNVPARRLLADTLRPLFPAKARWHLVEGEQPADDSSRTRVRIAQRTISHSDSGDPTMHLIGFRVTITVPTDTLEGAEAQLDDDLEAFLHALDAADVPWERAEKGQFADEGGRLGYGLDITIRTNPTRND